jgi:hypothetical protein
MDKKTLEQQGIKTAKPVAKLKRFTMVKNYVGNLAVVLESEDFSTPARMILFRFDQDEKQIPVKWAIGAMVSDGAFQQMEKGYFTFKEINEYIEMAEDMGHYVPDSIKEPKISSKDMKRALRKGDMQELKRILPLLQKQTKIDLIIMAQGLYGSLNMEVITLIEKMLQISLKTIDLTDVE